MKLSGITRNILTGMLLVSSTALMFQGCEKPSEMKSVDLRYRVEDAYTVAANGSESVTFKVKSTDPWTVFGTDESADWYSISPATGDDPSQTYDVVISFKENVDLDDRCDTINIKSDYWTGKRFTVTQKGIAFLNAKNSETVAQTGGIAKIEIESNQNWSAKLTEGSEWASISKGETGKLNGSIEVDLQKNQGEKRAATVSIFDRHEVLVATALCTQDGVVLTPAVPKNGKFFKVSKKEQDFSIMIESNGKWEVRKDNPTESDWMTIITQNGEGNGEIKIHLAQHEGVSVRQEKLIIQSEAIPGVTPVVKTVRIKQECEPDIKTFEVGDLSGDFYGEVCKEGKYQVYVEEIPAGANLNIFFTFKDSKAWMEARFHVIGGKTDLSTTPWQGGIYSENSNKYVVDGSHANIFEWEINKVTTPEGEFPDLKWFINGDQNILNGGGKAEIIWNIPWADCGIGVYPLIRAIGGTVKVTKWVYIPSIDWGE